MIAALTLFAAISRGLIPRAAQRGFQSLLLLMPAGVFGPRSLLESLQFALDGRGLLRMVPLSLG